MVILWNCIITQNNFFIWMYYKMSFIPVMQSWIFSIITQVFTVTWSFRNHSNMLIGCSRNISYYYQCWKQLDCLIFSDEEFWWTKTFKNSIYPIFVTASLNDHHHQFTVELIKPKTFVCISRFISKVCLKCNQFKWQDQSSLVNLFDHIFSSRRLRC